MGALPGLCVGTSTIHPQGMLWADWLCPAMGCCTGTANSAGCGSQS